MGGAAGGGGGGGSKETQCGADVVDHVATVEGNTVRLSLSLSLCALCALYVGVHKVF